MRDGALVRLLSRWSGSESGKLLTLDGKPYSGKGKHASV